MALALRLAPQQSSTKGEFLNECKPDPKGALICGFGGTFVWWIACKALNVYEDGDFMWKQINFFYILVFKIFICGICIAAILIPLFYLFEYYMNQKISKVYQRGNEVLGSICERIKTNEEKYQKDKKYFEAKIEELLLRTKPEDPKEIHTTEVETELNAQNFV